MKRMQLLADYPDCCVNGSLASRAFAAVPGSTRVQNRTQNSTRCQRDVRHSRLTAALPGTSQTKDAAWLQGCAVHCSGGSELGLSTAHQSWPSFETGTCGSSSAHNPHGCECAACTPVGTCLGLILAGALAGMYCRVLRRGLGGLAGGAQCARRAALHIHHHH